MKKLLYTKFYTLLFLLSVNLLHAASDKTISEQASNALFNNLPKVALLVKEQYVDPERIHPDAMLASILQALEGRITKLVVTMPQDLSSALDSLKEKRGEKNSTSKLKRSEKKSSIAQEPQKIVFDFAGVKKEFSYEPQRSIWGVIFMLKDIFKFVQEQSEKNKDKSVSSPIEWEKIESSAINGMLSTLDPHSVYLEPKYARDLTLTTKGEFGGIGIVISVRDGFLTVISPIVGTPAAKSGVKAKDRIIKINDDSAINMDLNDAVNILRGKPDTVVKITIQRQKPFKEIEFSLKRAIIKVESVSHSMINENVGYVQIKAFQGNTASDVKDALVKLKQESKNKLKGIVLDLRQNPGGLLREAVEVSSLFLDGGEVVSTKGAREESRQIETASPGEVDNKLLIACLVDGGSASASEIVAAALKSGGPDNGRAVVIGEQTFGKGSVQMLFDFPVSDTGKKNEQVQPAALKLTIAEYFGPNNTSMQNIGVTPDIHLAPAYVNKASEIKLFPESGRREVDLEGHLSFAKTKNSVEERPIASIEYLAPDENEETDGEYGKLDVNKLKSDFFINTAVEFIKNSSASDRDSLLKNADAIKESLQREENKKIALALKKYSIDWSIGESENKKDIKAWVSENKPANAGGKLKVSVKIKNTSNKPIYQVHGITEAKTYLFDQKELLFGKIDPGQEVTRALELDIPKDVVERKDYFKLNLRDITREKISELHVPVAIDGLKRPRLAHMAYVEYNNSDEANLVVWIKNVGQGSAFEPTVLLRNESGSKVFLKNGRFQSKELKPGQEAFTKFAFRVKEPAGKLDFELQIFDGKMHDLWRDKIVVDLKKKKDLKTVKKYVQLKDSNAPLISSESGNNVIATLNKGKIYLASKESEKHLLIEVAEGVKGFVSKAYVSVVPSPSSKDKSTYSINYDHTPAEVQLRFGDQSGWSKTSSGKISATIKSTDNLSNLLLYVNADKVLYKDLSNTKGEFKFEYLVKLKPGINVISLFAQENDLYGQRENIVVYYDEDGYATKHLNKKSKTVSLSK